MQHALRLLLKTRMPAIYAAVLLLVTPLSSLTPVSHAQEQLNTGHIAVIMPLKSDSLGRQADAVRRGALQAAAANKEGPAVVVHATSDDLKDILATYNRAVQEGAQAVIGPLSRTAVNALARGGKIRIPTLALNAIDSEIVIPRQLYSFGLQIDSEAKQLARIAAKKGLRRALVVRADTPVSSRIVEAFKSEWSELGGTIVEQIPYASDSTQLIKLRDKTQAVQADLVLLALDSSRARTVRPYIGGAISVFATSLAYASNDPLENFDLEGVIFVDMPWLLIPDHPAVITYNQVAAFTTLEIQRFYALGIDAYRIAVELVRPALKIDDEPLDGVTGLVMRGQNQGFVRELTPAEFHNGVARVMADTVFR